MSLPLHEMINALFGVKTIPRINPEVTQVDIVVTKILPYNPRRLSFVIFNLSGNSVYISPFRSVSATNGIYLAANGGSASLIWDRDFELCCYEWFATAGANDSEIFILENYSE